MKKLLLTGAILSLPAIMSAQSAIDAYSMSQNDLRGTARFMSMAGAFTALGGDISTLNQNPGGIGIYRSSDIGVTLDLDMQKSSSTTSEYITDMKQTKFNCNNFGYIGAVTTGSDLMPYFNWGVSYSRTASFDRRYSGTFGQLGTSLTNLVADYTNRDLANGDYTLNEISGTNAYNDTWAPWTSILMYQGYGINPTQNGSNKLTGLFNEGVTYGSGYFDVEEKGGIDEYSLNLGGNFVNSVYWGIGFGITDIDFKQYSWYGESFDDADISFGNAYTSGEADMELSNFKHIYGNGFNFKAGLIFKPVNEFRIGLAIHTPTYYNLTYEGQGAVNYRYYSDLYEDNRAASGNVATPYDDFDFKLRTPWRFMAGVAGVVGGQAILSVDYEYRAYSDMKVQDWYGEDYRDVNDDVKTYNQATNTLRIGAEYRFSPYVSLRAGYSYETSPVKATLLDEPNYEAEYVYTSGPDDTETNPAYTLDRSTQYITAGLGYRYQRFYADLAYVRRYRQSDYHAFTNYNDSEGLMIAPSAKLSDHNNSLVLTLGFRF